MSLNKDALHVLLARRAGPSRVVRVNQAELAKRLKIARSTLCETLNEMVAEGRLKKIGGSGVQPRTFEVLLPPEAERRGA